MRPSMPFIRPSADVQTGNSFSNASHSSVFTSSPFGGGGLFAGVPVSTTSATQNFLFGSNAGPANVPDASTLTASFGGRIKDSSVLQTSAATMVPPPPPPAPPLPITAANQQIPSFGFNPSSTSLFGTTATSTNTIAAPLGFGASTSRYQEASTISAGMPSTSVPPAQGFSFGSNAKSSAGPHAPTLPGYFTSMTNKLSGLQQFGKAGSKASPPPLPCPPPLPVPVPHTASLDNLSEIQDQCELINTIMKTSLATTLKAEEKEEQLDDLDLVRKLANSRRNEGFRKISPAKKSGMLKSKIEFSMIIRMSSVFTFRSSSRSSINQNAQ